MNILFCGRNQHSLLQHLAGAGYQLVTHLTTVKPEYHGSLSNILRLLCSQQQKSTYLNFRERKKKNNKKEKAQPENRFHERSKNHCDPANNIFIFGYKLLKHIWPEFGISINL